MRRNPLIGLLLAPLMLGALALPAHADEPIPAPAASIAPTSAADLEGKLADLKAQADKQAKAVEAAKVDLDRLTKESQAALEALGAANEAKMLADEAERVAQEQVKVAEAEVDKAQGILDRLASRAYRGQANGPIQQMDVILDVRGVGEALHGAKLAEKVNDSQVDALQSLHVAERKAQAARAAAEEAASEKKRAQEAAQAAKDTADRLKTEQATLLAQLESALSVTNAQALGAETDLATIRAAVERLKASRAAEMAKNEQMRLAAQNAALRIAQGEGSSCEQVDTSAYGNGLIPRSALCPLATAPGHVLTAVAASGFDAMSNAYAQAFGQPICVTDSYRSLAAQIDVRERKPGLAAKPGTSNHGWGRAVDLGCGIQTFGTPQHEWMQQNAYLYGWFHPSWAEEDGSKPEAWHWESALG